MAHTTRAEQPCSFEERDLNQTTDLNDAQQTYTEVLPNGAVLTVLNVPVTVDPAHPPELQFSPEVLARLLQASRAFQAEDPAENAYRSLEYTTLPGVPSAVSVEIRRAMQARQVTPADLARKLGVRRSRLDHWLDPDTHNHKITTLQRIADALDCELIVLFR